MTASPSRLLAPRFLFFAVSIAVLLALSLSPLTRKWLGIFDGGQWFLDSYAVLAGSDAHLAGIAPDAPNPLDVLQRSHSYSDWWFGLGKLGLTREDNFLLGGSWVLAFLAVVFLTIKPSTRTEAFWLAALLASPPVLLGINRANNDLLVFALLGLALLALRPDSNRRVAIAIALVALATGLKFYPVVAVGAFMLVRPSRRILGVMSAAVLVVGAMLASVASQVSRGAFPLTPKPHRMGGRMVFLDLGLTGSTAAVVTLLIFGAGVFLAVRYRWTGEPAGGRDLSDNRRMMTMGSVVLLACFLLGINLAYRWIFVLWTAPWLWENRGRSVAARAGVWLLPFAMWHDGVLCLAINRWVPHLSVEQYARLEVWWRAATEPFVWLLMILLGGWLFNVGWSAAREIWPRLPQTAASGPGKAF
jgi:Glycosyltransferase family 87